MIRTSKTNPLQIAVLPLLGGEIGMTLCPGKRDKHAMSGIWWRDMAQDVDVIRQWGAELVVTLMTQGELDELHVSKLGTCIQQADIHWEHYPIIDGKTPRPQEEGYCRKLSSFSRGDDCLLLTARIRLFLARGAKVLIHCRGGLGRTGLIAARLLIEEGAEPAEAMACVRATRPNAIENAEQEDYLKQLPARLCDNVIMHKIHGMLLGGACGDALGAAVEFKSLAEIRSAYGEQGLRDFAPAYGRKGTITDDTQMTLFTAEAIISEFTCRSSTYACIQALHRAYIRWYATQTTHREDLLEHSLLTPFPELWQNRAPGNTCLNALNGAVAGRYPHNNSKGCGTVIRVAPLATQFTGEQDLFGLASLSSRLTHGHPNAGLSAGFLVILLQSLLQGDKLPVAIDRAVKILTQQPDHEEVLHALNRAREQAQHGATTTLPACLGQGWIAEEALAIALYCALVHDTFEEAVIAAVNHDGDSDSTGSIAGQICGAMYSDSAIPARWLEQLELKDAIQAMADMLTDPHKRLSKIRAFYD